jgi:hypothetical protein
LYETHILGDIEQKLKIVRNLAVLWLPRNAHKSFEVANLVFHSWLRSKQHIKKSELHDLLQGRTFFYVYTWCPRTRAPEKRGEIFIKRQINNPNEKLFYVERYSRKEQFNSTNQSILSHPGLFPVIVAGLHIL